MVLVGGTVLCEVAFLSTVETTSSSFEMVILNWSQLGRCLVTKDATTLKSIAVVVDEVWCRAGVLLT